MATVAEIKLAAYLAEHNIDFNAADHLGYYVTHVNHQDYQSTQTLRWLYVTVRMVTPFALQANSKQQTTGVIPRAKHVGRLYGPHGTKVRKRWLCRLRGRGAGWSRLTILPSRPSSERLSGRGGTRASPPSTPSTSSSTASERAHIRAATAPCRAPASPRARSATVPHARYGPPRGRYSRLAHGTH
ncbi:unnamed protein product [Parnassius apollo]|uniref:(apollo) hypothetical protein n=1 Tax=Parnassius apollo TaxID=110799 RepID=A0A8S3WMC0_PARAO|nr:unnamed protein product [Parnassius apollo]